jgi:hypothetical protein
MRVVPVVRIDDVEATDTLILFVVEVPFDGIGEPASGRRDLGAEDEAEAGKDLAEEALRGAPMVLA